MADLRIGATPFFERGIDSVVEMPKDLFVPDSQELAPATLATPAALEELLQAENLESLLEASVRPELAERGLLAPHRFLAAIGSALALFESQADERRHANPRLGKLLDHAAGVLAEEIALRDLLQMYRGALLQG
jgi:type III secretion protein X